MFLYFNHFPGDPRGAGMRVNNAACHVIQCQEDVDTHAIILVCCQGKYWFCIFSCYDFFIISQNLLGKSHIILSLLRCWVTAKNVTVYEQFSGIRRRWPGFHLFSRLIYVEVRGGLISSITFPSVTPPCMNGACYCPIMVCSCPCDVSEGLVKSSFLNTVFHPEVLTGDMPGKL